MTAVCPGGLCSAPLTLHVAPYTQNSFDEKYGDRLSLSYPNVLPELAVSEKCLFKCRVGVGEQCFILPDAWYASRHRTHTLLLQSQ